jgi:hypothetical protein
MLEDFLECHCSVMLVVLCRIHEGHCFLSRFFPESLYQLRLFPDLVRIFCLKDQPLRRTMGEPLSKLVARCNLLKPFVDFYFLFLDASRPKSVNENALAVLG